MERGEYWKHDFRVFTTLQWSPRPIMLLFYDSNPLENDDDDDDERGHLLKYEPCLVKVVKLYKSTMFGLFGAPLLHPCHRHQKSVKPFYCVDMYIDR